MIWQMWGYLALPEAGTRGQDDHMIKHPVLSLPLKNMGLDGTVSLIKYGHSNLLQSDKR